MNVLYRSGGMPSTHTAGVVALALSVLFAEGVSTVFMIALAFAVVVINDAMGVRLEATKHAQFLNRLVKKMKFDKQYFSEHIGHHMPEVIVGGLIGCVVTVIVFML
jgi:acid phosphatase family membrane protein YuiD